MNWNPTDTAPRDGTLLRLLVQYEEHPLDDDNTQPQETIGFNTLDQSGIDDWHFAGWDWSHDSFAQGIGEVVGWLPMGSKNE
ncbi:hypothetical protein NFC81_09265 [Salinispirillum sp. LH 10-3-1]|uniref:Uncharacterized protein n=1 Tax=Salinispirillum sp. LH 10-3-1 TaxID=2952525 RepID=A0AB38YC18_9GAMM